MAAELRTKFNLFTYLLYLIMIIILRDINMNMIFFQIKILNSKQVNAKTSKTILND